jgi:hypothetical protein
MGTENTGKEIEGDDKPANSLEENRNLLAQLLERRQ